MDEAASGALRLGRDDSALLDGLLHRHASGLQRGLLYLGVVQQWKSPMTTNTERRNFLAGVGAAAASAAVLATTQTFAQGNQPNRSQVDAVSKPSRCRSTQINIRNFRKVLVSHYENNYVGAVKRLNAIGTQLAELDFAKAPNFVINGLKREN